MARHPDASRVAAVGSDAVQGSGYLLTPWLVLTAGHLVPPGAVAWVAVVGGSGRRTWCDVVWHGGDGPCDAALLQTQAPLLQDSPDWSEWPQFGGMDGIAAFPGARAVGFPEVQRTGQALDSELVIGTLKSGSKMVAGRYVLECGPHPPEARSRGGSPWQGMSGAAVFADDLLMGVVVADPGGWKHARLEVVPASEIVPQIRGVVAARARWEPGIRMIEDRADFDSVHARSIEKRYGTLNVLGIDLSRSDHAEWPLETAYLSLEAVSAGRYGRLRHAHFGTPGVLTPDLVPDAPTPQRVEEALADRPRVLIRGAAGSGKTTLVQWLATTAARKEFTGQLAHLNGRVPFVLPMRTVIRHNSQSLPPPDEFLRAVSHPRVGVQPPGWADEVMASGRALLLVDGLDEVPQSFRNLTRTWLGELMAEFPETRCVVTARPSATPEGWLGGHGFDELALAPMSRADVRVFVGRWHDTARAACGSPEEVDQLDEFQQRLLDGISSKSDLARLVTNPLMCALVCALNRDRRAHLPRGRKELYDAGLRLLLVRRDEQHDIRGTEEVELTEEEQASILQRLAYWLIRNGRSEADQNWFREMITKALPELASLRRSSGMLDNADLADRVFHHLLGRSGLLREPTMDTVDFVHRTFQDYLGARAVIEDGDLGLLIRNAHDDQWEDVLRMAVAHGRPKERSQLIRELVERGDREPRHRVRLHLLAWSCTGEAPQIDPAVQLLVDDRAKALLPPRDRDAEQALIEAGPVVLDLLPSSEDLDHVAATAEVRVAGAIGGDAALVVLRRFACTATEFLSHGLSAQWPQFRAEDFAENVIAYLPESVSVIVNSRAELAATAHIGRTSRLDLRYAASEHDLATLVDAENLKLLTLTHRGAAEALHVLGGARQLDSLFLANNEVVREASPALAGLLGLTYLAMIGVEVSRLDGFPILPKVAGLLLIDPTGMERSGELFRSFPALQELHIDNSPQTGEPIRVDLTPAATLPLQRLTVEGDVILEGVGLFPPGVIERVTPP